MGLLGGGFLRLFQTLLYALAFACSAIIIGIYSYFLAVLSDRNVPIARNWLAVEGISGVAVVYTIFGVILTCCLGGMSFFGFLAIVFNVAFAGAFIALAVLTRDGAGSCSGTVTTPLGTGSASSRSGFGAGGVGVGQDQNVTYASSLGTACRFNKVAFAVSIAGASLFLALAVVQVFLVRHSKKEKRFGPSPANNYTSGTGRRFPWQRKKGAAAAGAGAGAYATRDTEMGGVDTRPSHDTAYTGSTVAAPPPPQTGFVKDAEPVGHSTHDRYYNAGVSETHNPYGYNNAGVNETQTPYGYNNAAPARNF
ncbi:5'-3' exoribonuclease 2 [Sphaceloma murrayae]|uniref:5'-3' exoribonuclease 2 n=1 Tax=Sphaceloma murrayae TaxID=2082308 RepID=A0A2K1R0K3_9PEZI|nr:5'-3' exoribonuclease 2 [Sphaceloma murrayae]